MQQRIFFNVIVIFCSMFLIFGCSKNEDSKTTATPGQTVQAPAGASGNADLSRAAALYKTFTDEFTYVAGGVTGVEHYRQRAEYTDQIRTKAMALQNEIQDPQAKEFLTRFADKLQQYTDAGRKLVSASEELQKIDKQIEEGNASISQMTDANEKMRAKMLLDGVKSGRGTYASAKMQAESTLQNLTGELVRLK